MIAAIDCDLRESFCVFADGRAGRGVCPFAALDTCASGPPPATLLFEIASPVSFNRGAAGHAAMTQLAKWAIWNTAQAMRLHMFCGNRGFQRLLVAPSNVWTHGYDEKTRHAIASCKAKKKDLRECEAMLFFHRLHPEDWVPLSTYLESL